MIKKDLLKLIKSGDEIDFSHKMFDMVRDDKSFIIELLKESPYEFKHTSNQIQNDIEFILELFDMLPISTYIYEELPSEIRHNDKIINSALTNGCSLEYFDKTTVNKLSFEQFSKILSLYPFDLCFLPNKMKNNLDLVLIACISNGQSLDCCSKEVKNNFDFIYKLCENKCKNFFPYVSKKIKDWSNNSEEVFYKKYQNEILNSKIDNFLIKEKNNKIKI